MVLEMLNDRIEGLGFGNRKKEDEDEDVCCSYNIFVSGIRV